MIKSTTKSTTKSMTKNVIEREIKEGETIYVVDETNDETYRYKMTVFKVENGKYFVKEFIDTNDIDCEKTDNQLMNIVGEKKLSAVVEKIVCIVLFKGYTDFLIDKYENEKEYMGMYDPELYEGWSVKKQEYSGIYKSSNLAIKCLLNKISPDPEVHKRIFSICIDIVNDVMKEE